MIINVKRLSMSYDYIYDYKRQTFNIHIMITFMIINVKRLMCAL